MKILLALTMILGSTFAMADSEWKIKCYDSMNQRMDLAYILKVKGPEHIALLDCTEDMALAGECRFAGKLEREDRQNETCLVKKHWTPDSEALMGSFSLCYEAQETVERPKLVPITVTDDEQDGRVYCERKILHLLR